MTAFFFCGRIAGGVRWAWIGRATPTAFMRLTAAELAPVRSVLSSPLRFFACTESRSLDRQAKPLPPDQFRHQESAIGRNV